VGWVSCCRGQTVDPVVNVLFPPAHRPGTFAAETARRRERPVPLPTPDRGSAQPGDSYDFGQSHHPPTPGRLRHRASTADTRLPAVDGLVPHPLSLSPAHSRGSCAGPQSVVPQPMGTVRALFRHRRYRGGSGTRSRFHPLGVALNRDRSRIPSSRPPSAAQQGGAFPPAAGPWSHPGIRPRVVVGSGTAVPVLRHPGGGTDVPVGERGVAEGVVGLVAVALNRDRSRIRSRILVTWASSGGSKAAKGCGGSAGAQPDSRERQTGVGGGTPVQSHSTRGDTCPRQPRGAPRPQTGAGGPRTSTRRTVVGGLLAETVRIGEALRAVYLGSCTHPGGEERCGGVGRGRAAKRGSGERARELELAIGVTNAQGSGCRDVCPKGEGTYVPTWAGQEASGGKPSFH